MLEALDDNVWVARYDLRSLGLHFPGRMTVVRLANNELWLCSPIPIDDGLAAELEALGTVKYLIAPNRFHHVHLGPVRERYPEAKLFASPGLAEKRKDLSFDAVLENESPPEWSGAFQQIVLSGIPTFNEVVFFHEASRSLITTDLFMNVHEAEGAMSRLVYWLEGCWKKPRVPRLITLMTKDRVQTASHAQQIASWPIRRLILAHGELVEQEAEKFVREELTRRFGQPETAQSPVP